MNARLTEKILDSDPTHDYQVLAMMEKKFEERDPRYFNEVLLNEPTLVVRVHAVTALSEIGDESSVPVLAEVMKKDPSPLIRHECAFSLGQMGLRSAVPYLCDSALNDPSEIVRHESAAALGAIGDESAREALEKASKDPSDEVKGSAIASLFNLDFLAYSAKHPLTAIVNEREEAERTKRKKEESESRRMPHP
ncbi:MAG TPA: HEAT repeat domain-containing protein [Nitrososphaerales archaeon]|nr:HEAT repeat domain-containing protein [Nitrososphaerales archaeon]